MPRRLLILGAGAHGRAVADLAAECGWSVVGFTERAATKAPPEVIGQDSDAAMLFRDKKIDGGIIGVGNTALPRRLELFQFLRKSGIPLPSLVHPRATLSQSCRVGEGSVIFPGSVLGAGVEVGDNAVIYSSVVAEHDCRIADDVYISPGVILSGAVTIETGAFVGAGAVVLPGITIGKHAVVAAGAVVVGDVAAGDTVLGLPARSKGGPR